MSQNKPIVIRKTRDFGEKLNATIEFIRANFKGLFRSIIFIGGPLMLVTSVLMGFYQNNVMWLGTRTSESIGPSSEVFMDVIGVSIFAMLFSVLTVALVITIINEYIIIYLEKQSSDIEPSEVWQRVKKDYLMILISSIGYSVLVLIGTVFFVFPGIYLFVTLSLIYIVQITERKGFFSAMSRCISIINGKWWSTFGINLVCWFIWGVLIYALLIPYYIVTFAALFHNISETGNATAFDEPSAVTKVLTIFFSAIYMMGSYIVMTIPVIGIAFQYFNLVERKESTGLMQKIDSFGTEKSTIESEEENEEY